jgi:hypothetical protein
MLVWLEGEKVRWGEGMWRGAPLRFSRLFLFSFCASFFSGHLKVVFNPFGQARQSNWSDDQFNLSGFIFVSGLRKLNFLQSRASLRAHAMRWFCL